MIDILDKSLDIFTIFFSSFIYKDNIEQECVDFYKKNNYITESCEIYTEKLEAINE